VNIAKELGRMLHEKFTVRGNLATKQEDVAGSMVINEAYYENDEIMAELGRKLLDMYVDQVKKYGSAGNEPGWPSTVRALIYDYLVEEDTNVQES